MSQHPNRVLVSIVTNEGARRRPVEHSLEGMRLWSGLRDDDDELTSPNRRGNRGGGRPREHRIEDLLADPSPKGSLEGSRPTAEAASAAVNLLGIPTAEAAFRRPSTGSRFTVLVLYPGTMVPGYHGIPPLYTTVPRVHQYPGYRTRRTTPSAACGGPSSDGPLGSRDPVIFGPRPEGEQIPEVMSG